MPTTTATLDPSTHSQIRDLCTRGQQLVDQHQYEKAYAFYTEALSLVPAPAECSEATTGILASIADLYFITHQFPQAIATLQDALRCPGGAENPFLHLRLGQSAFELNDLPRATESLARAYQLGGNDLFHPENPKYLRFLFTHAKCACQPLL